MSQSDWDRLEDYKLRIIEGDTIAMVWSDEDVKGRMEELSIELDVGEIRDVLSLLDNEHDACIGINWDMIDFWIDHVANER